MRKASVLGILMLMAAAPALAFGGGSQGSEETSFSFFIDPIAGPEKAEFELVVRNKGAEDLSLEFPTSQKYEITVFDAEKKKVFQYSEGKAFAQAFQELVLKPQESIRWKETWVYDMSGAQLPPGDYTVVAKLKATGLNGKQIAGHPALEDTKTMYIPEKNPAFRKVASTGTQGKYIVAGEARGRFYYSVEDGHNELVSQTEVNAGPTGWKPFRISIEIPEEKWPENGSITLNLYEIGEDGAIIHSYPVLLERFGK